MEMTVYEGGMGTECGQATSQNTLGVMLPICREERK